MILNLDDFLDNQTMLKQLSKGVINMLHYQYQYLLQMEKNIKNPYQNNKLNISRPTWYEHSK